MADGYWPLTKYFLDKSVADVLIVDADIWLQGCLANQIFGPLTRLSPLSRIGL